MCTQSYSNGPHERFKSSCTDEDKMTKCGGNAFPASEELVGSEGNKCFKQ